MGIVGYGDIGQACARLAKAFKMHVVALRRNTQLTAAEQEAGVVVSAVWACVLRGLSTDLMLFRNIFQP
jgi:phosphoglycerate dehydrogenase-like enzyme